MTFGHILVPSSVPGTELAFSMCQRNRNGLYPVGKGDEKPGEETPALMWMKDPCPVQDMVTGTDGLGVWLAGEGCTP